MLSRLGSLSYQGSEGSSRLCDVVSELKKERRVFSSSIPHASEPVF